MAKINPEIADKMPVNTDVNVENPEMPIEQPMDVAPEEDPNLSKIADLEKYKATMEEANQKIMDVLDAEPVLAKIIQDISMGASFREAIARHIDPEDLTAQSDDPDFEGWEKNRAARADEMGKRKEFNDKLSANREMTISEIKAFAEETGKSPEQMIEFMGNVDELFSNVYAGLIDRKTLTLLEKAITADEAVAEAKEDGIVEGRNAKIKETMVPAKVGDGLPKIAASQDNATAEPPVRKGYIERIKS